MDDIDAPDFEPDPAASAFAEARTGLLRATLLFGSIATALALIVVPAVDKPGKGSVAARLDEVDMVTTGSIRHTDTQRYIVRRSVLQGPDREPCLLFPNGTQRGAC